MRIARGGTVGQRHAQTSSLPCAQRLRVCSTPTRPTVPSAAFFYCAYAQTAYTCTMLQRVSCVPRRPSKSVCNARREALVGRGSQPCGTLTEDAENNFVCPSVLPLAQSCCVPSLCPLCRLAGHVCVLVFLFSLPVPFVSPQHMPCIYNVHTALSCQLWAAGNSVGMVQARAQGILLALPHRHLLRGMPLTRIWDAGNEYSVYP